MPAKILYIDDHLDSVETMKLLLGKEGYEVGIACTQNEALAAIKQRLYDLYILDMFLPQLDGLELCRIIRIADQNVPILVYSARVDPAYRATAYLAGANKYLLKPEELDAIVPAIRELTV